jgi:integrase/recombinase XerD
MNTLPGEDEDRVQRFITSLPLRSNSTRSAYRCHLRNFLLFVRTRTRTPMTLDQKTIVAWLKDRRQHCALHEVEQRAQLVDRFLDWMTKNGYIPSHPFQALRSHYGQRTAPIARALLSVDATAALERLRPPPVFASVLGPLIRGYLELMRSLGYRYITTERSLRRFDRFLQSRADLVGKPLPVMIDAWRKAHTGVGHRLEAQRCGRILSKALRRLDASAAIVPLDRRLRRQAQGQQRRPYIYTEEEVAKLLTTARSFPSPRSPLRPHTAYLMLVLAYCAGLRLAEVAHLTMGDVDLEHGTIEIRETKFFKMRRLAMTTSVMTALQTYLEERRNAGAPTSAETGLFWNQKTNRGYAPSSVSDLLIKVLRLSGIKPGQGRIGPRVHDLRHAMVCNRTLSWYKQGINPQSRLVHLSTFLGHRDINSTLAYLTITPELLQLASERYRQHAVHVLKKTEKRE